MACAPCGEPPLTIPVVADCLPKQVVEPCEPSAACGGVCVPMVAPCPPPALPPPPRRRCKYVQPARPRSYAPQRCYLPPTAKMEESTIYRKSFLPSEGHRPCPIFPENHLCVGEGKISDSTVHKMSFLPQCAQPPCPIIPCSHKLLGEGPMQDLTTQKHDYVAKPFSKPCLIVPPISLYGSDCPLSDKTVNRLSYAAPCELRRVNPIYPIDGLEKPCGRMSDKTVHSMSFQPWRPQEPVPTPWALRAPYKPPMARMENNTVNRMSYVPPGEYVECAPDDPDCVECPPIGCHGEDPNHFRKDPKCVLNCCCPRASC